MVLLHQHARGQLLDRVARQNRHQSLLQNGAGIQISRHLVHRATGKLAARINGPLVGVQTGKGRQQRGVDIDEPTTVVRHKAGREDAHETCQHHQGGRMGIDALHQRGIKGLAAVIGLVVHHRRGNALRLGKLQATRLGLVADHSRNPRPQGLLPALLLRGTHDGRHIGAAAGDQDDDVFHGGGIIAGRRTSRNTLHPQMADNQKLY